MRYRVNRHKTDMILLTYASFPKNWSKLLASSFSASPHRTVECVWQARLERSKEPIRNKTSRTYLHKVLCTSHQTCGLVAKTLQSSWPHVMFFLPRCPVGMTMLLIKAHLTLSQLWRYKRSIANSISFGVDQVIVPYFKRSHWVTAMQSKFWAFDPGR